MAKLFKTKILISAVVIMIFIVAIIFAIFDWRRFLTTPLIPATLHMDYLFYPGHNARDLAKDLEAAGYLHDPNKFILLAHLVEMRKKLRAGEYRFNGGVNPLELLKQIAFGRVLIHNLTIIEGWNFQQVMAALARAPSLMHQLEGQTPQQIMQKLGLTTVNPEGLFFPATYSYKWGASDIGILRWANRVMQRRLAREWHNKAQGLPYQNPYQALIVASLIEKETALTSERPLVAAVILKRWTSNMLLQIDPTVIYGLGPSYNGKLTKEDLHFNTPYNTYLNKGIPPTPIAMPSLDSIHAALHPANTNVVYFVATGYGGHQFSRTYQEHERAVRNYKSVISHHTGYGFPGFTQLSPYKDLDLLGFGYDFSVKPPCLNPVAAFVNDPSLKFSSCSEF